MISLTIQCLVILLIAVAVGLALMIVDIRGIYKRGRKGMSTDKNMLERFRDEHFVPFMYARGLSPWLAAAAWNFSLISGSLLVVVGATVLLVTLWAISPALSIASFVAGCIAFVSALSAKEMMNEIPEPRKRKDE